MQAFLEPKDKAAWSSEDSTGVQGIYNKSQPVIYSCCMKQIGNATFLDSLALHEVYKRELFAWSLAHDRYRTSVSWIQISASCQAG